ncbi:hypothetical protein MMC17_009957 [Xylographa soralifera]|nr:hypothetical protein [Xylographa soralifera]
MELFQPNTSAYFHWIRLIEPYFPRLDDSWREWIRFDGRENCVKERDPANFALPLFYASLGGLEETVRLLLNKAADVNDSTGSKGTASHAAANRGCTRIVQLLLTNAADPDGKNDKGQAPLAHAAGEGQLEIVEILLAREDVDPHSKDEKGLTPLLRAASAGHEAIIKLLLGKGLDPDWRNKRGQSALALAAAHGHEGMITLLLERDSVDPNSQDEDERTPLWQAAYHDHAAIIKLLLDRGADPNLSPIDRLASKGTEGWNPLSLAAIMGRELVVELLLAQDGVDPNAKDPDGRTPLALAASAGRISAVKLLLERRKVDLSTENPDQLALSLAIRRGHGATVKLLVENGFDPNFCNGIYNPLMDAASSHKHNIVKILLETNSVDPNFQVPETGETPLMWAAAYAADRSVDLLLKDKRVDRNLKDAQGRTALYWARKNLRNMPSFGMALSYTVRILEDTGDGTSYVDDVLPSEVAKSNEENSPLGRHCRSTMERSRRT